jgi:phosphopantothenoylcysteine decarboxylase / phosphopantothenate---cysteine ligase
VTGLSDDRSSDDRAGDDRAGDGPRVLLGVGGGVAAYKVAQLLRLLTEAEHDVVVVPTRAALQFVGEATWAALSGHPVRTDVWQDAHEVPHVRLGRSADLLVVAPATADLIARAAHGLADDLLTNTLLTVRCPVLLAPAMHTEMWEHPATRANVATLRSRGVVVIEPTSGRLTGADSGPGRLPEPVDLFDACRRALAGRTPVRTQPVGDLAGRRVLITSGGTREPIDPVRYLGNRSSGKQGNALAAEAVARGAQVLLISASSLPAPAGARVVQVETAAELRESVLANVAGMDVVVMAAAVADFRPARVAEHKIKKNDPQTSSRIELVRNPDVLSEVVTGRRAGQVVVGFAAETGDDDGDVLAHGRAKLRRKGCHLLVVNDVGGGRTFGSDTTSAVILSSGGGGDTVVPEGPKSALARAVWDAVREVLVTAEG